MKRKIKRDGNSVFDVVISGLQDSILYSRGELELKETRLPAPPPAQGAKQIVKLRKELKLSQGVFAKTLNVSTKTVQGWEQGLRRPSQASLRLLQLITENPLLVQSIAAYSPARRAKSVAS